MVTILSGPRNNYRENQGTVLIPIDSTSYCKIIITDDNGVDYTVMDTYGGLSTNNYTMNGNVTLICSDGIGSFSLQLVNDGGQFYKTFNGGEYVKIYMDETNATTLLMYARIDNVSYGISDSNGFFVEIDGRECPELVDKTITGIQVAATADSSLGDIFYNNYSYIKLQFWNGIEWINGIYNNITRIVSWAGDATSLPTALINITYQNKKGISVISEILSRANLDGYLYYDETNSQFYYRIFNSESINNDLGIAFGVNLISANNYGIDNNQLYNKIIAYGKKESDNIILLKTKEDSSSQSDLWVKDKVINDSDSDSMESLNDKAISELSKSLILTPNGSFTAVGLTNLRPGELIQVSIPYTVNDTHKVNKITHNIGDIITTTIEVTKKNTQISDLFIQQLNPDEITGIENINNMKDSYTVFFSSTEGVMSNSGTEEVDGRLKLIDGEITGTSTSAIITADYDITSCELRKYENYATGLDTYYVTNDGGNTWELVTIDGTTHTFLSPGNEIGFKLVLTRTLATDPSPQYESICLLYK